MTLCTVTFVHSTCKCGNYSREDTVQGRKLFPEIRYLTWQPSSQSQQVKNPSSKGMLTFFWGRRTVEYSTYNKFITWFHESWIYEYWIFPIKFVDCFALFYKKFHLRTKINYKTQILLHTNTFSLSKRLYFFLLSRKNNNK